MFESGSIEAEKLREFFKEITPFLYKYPTIAPADFAARVEEIVDLRKKY
jgi:hypothetical protein